MAPRIIIEAMEEAGNKFTRFLKYFLCDSMAYKHAFCSRTATMGRGTLAAEAGGGGERLHARLLHGGKGLAEKLILD
jgi:hypothetical protein